MLYWGFGDTESNIQQNQKTTANINMKQIINLPMQDDKVAKDPQLEL